MVRLACDVGGSFTDLVVADAGMLRLYKVPTTPADPAAGVLAAIGLAAAAAGIDAGTLLARTTSLTHATTLAINAILTGRTARTAFVTTEGHRDILLLREGGRLNPYDNLQAFPPPYVPRALTFEVPERIGAAGEVVRPLDVGVVAEIAERLAAEAVKAVGVCLLWSIANPAHEIRVGEILAARLPGVAVSLSHRLNPIVREYRRASATCIDASLRPLMDRSLSGLEARLRAAGFRGHLFVVTSQGGVMAAAEAAAAPIHTVNSGPSMAPVAGLAAAARDAPGLDAIIADAGGTSTDVSLVRGGRIPWTSETWIGPRFSGHMTGFPSVDVKSIGAGGGSIAWLDAGGLLRVGPGSAGADPGPACYRRGGEQPTVTDCALVLGYLDADRFLGGRLPLDAAAARRAVARIAAPLGLAVEAAAGAVFEVLTEEMIGAIEDITVNQGIDPSRAVLVAGGGAAGFNAAAIARRLGCRAALFPPTGAVLSAAGASLSDLMFTDGRIHYVRSDAPDHAAIARVLTALAASMRRFVAASGAARHAIDWWAEARYPQQTWEIEVPLAGPDWSGEADLDRLVRDFHAAHQALYAVADPASPIEILAWRARARCGLHAEQAMRVAASASATAATRRVFLPDGGWREVALRTPEGLADASLPGPALIESPFTTIVVPPGACARRLASGSIEVCA
jgi:N-methylhydantoinase A